MRVTDTAATKLNKTVKSLGQSFGLAFGGATPTTVSCTEESSLTPLTQPTFQYSPETSGSIILSQVSSSLEFDSDAAAEAGGVPLGGLYRDVNGFVKIRLT